jgi:rhomboid family GlyGly-CTERM serine protease
MITKGCDGLSTSSRPFLPPLSHRAWLLLGLAAVGMVLLWLGGEPVRAALRYERAAILDGEVWRLLTGHLVHFDLRHLVLNLAGAGLMVLLFGSGYSARHWLWILAASVVAIDAGFFVLEPQLLWYVGVSGVLHGVLAAGAVSWWRTEPKWMASILTVIVIGKLGWEQMQGGLQLSGDMPVVVAAHLYGAVGGILAALALIPLQGRANTHRPL